MSDQTPVAARNCGIHEPAALASYAIRPAWVALP